MYLIDVSAYLNLFWCPDVQFSGAYLRDVSAKTSVNTSTSVANEDSQVDWGPRGI